MKEEAGGLARASGWRRSSAGHQRKGTPAHAAWRAQQQRTIVHHFARHAHLLILPRKLHHLRSWCGVDGGRTGRRGGRQQQRGSEAAAARQRAAARRPTQQLSSEGSCGPHPPSLPPVFASSEDSLPGPWPPWPRLQSPWPAPPAPWWPPSSQTGPRRAAAPWWSAGAGWGGSKVSARVDSASALLAVRLAGMQVTATRRPAPTATHPQPPAPSHPPPPRLAPASL